LAINQALKGSGMREGLLMRVGQEVLR
jgi:hypothetical protein